MGNIEQKTSRSQGSQLGDTQPIDVAAIVAALEVPDEPSVANDDCVGGRESFNSSDLGADEPSSQPQTGFDIDDFPNLLAMVRVASATDSPDHSPTHEPSPTDVVLTVWLSSQEIKLMNGQVMKLFSPSFIEKIHKMSNYEGHDLQDEISNSIKMAQKKIQEFGIQVNLLNQYLQQPIHWDQEFVKQLVTIESRSVHTWFWQSHKLKNQILFPEAHQLLMDLRSQVIVIVWLNQTRPELFQKHDFADIRTYITSQLFEDEQPVLFQRAMDMKQDAGGKRQQFVTAAKDGFEATLSLLIKSGVVQDQKGIDYLLETEWSEVEKKLRQSYELGPEVDLSTVEGEVRTLIINLNNLRLFGWTLQLLDDGVDFSSTSVLQDFELTGVDRNQPLTQEIHDLINAEAPMMFDGVESMRDNPEQVRGLYQDIKNLGAWFSMYDDAYTRLSVLKRLAQQSWKDIDKELQGRHLWNDDDQKDQAEKDDLRNKVNTLKHLVWLFILLKKPLPNLRLLNPGE